MPVDQTRPDLVEVVARWLCARCGVALKDWDNVGPGTQRLHRMAAADLLAALSSAEVPTSDEPDHWEWASQHDVGGGLLQETGRDEALARMRVETWRTEFRPDVASRLLRRPVYKGRYEEASDAAR